MFCQNFGIVLVPSTDPTSRWVYDAIDCECPACRHDREERGKMFTRAENNPKRYCTACCRTHARCVCFPNEYESL